MIPVQLLSEDCRHHTVPQCFSLLALAPMYKANQYSSRQASVVSLAQWLAPVAGICLPFPCFVCLLSLSTFPNYIYHLLCSFILLSLLLSLPIFFSISNFHDTVRKCGAGPCWGTLCPALTHLATANFTSRLTIKAKGGASLSKTAKMGWRMHGGWLEFARVGVTLFLLSLCHISQVLHLPLHIYYQRSHFFPVFVPNPMLVMHG